MNRERGREGKREESGKRWMLCVCVLTTCTGSKVYKKGNPSDKKLVCFTSVHSHYSIARAVAICGIGT